MKPQNKNLTIPSYFARLLFVTGSLLLVALIIIFTCFATIVKAEIIEVPLYKLAPVETVDLRSTSSGFSISIGIPERWEIKRAFVNLSYVNSSALLKERSRLTVKMNNYPVAQIVLNPVVPEGTTRILIPPLLLGPGYNNLGISVSQHYSFDCENVVAPELWTTLKLKETSLHIEYALKPVPLRLSSIAGFLFDPKIFPQGEVHIITEDLSSEMITIAGVATSGISLRYDYRKVVFSMSREVKPDCENVLIGRKEFVEEFLKQNGMAVPNIEGPLLKITHLPRKGSAPDPTHGLLVISGVDSDQVRLAAETLAIVSFPYPDTDEMMPIKFEVPEVALYSGKSILTAGKKYTFKNLDLDTHTFIGLYPNSKEISFRLPPDFFIKPNQYANLSLGFAYGAGLRHDSALNIQVNGKHIQSIHLDNQNGNIFEGYSISIPTHLFKPGDNVIRFDPLLMPTIVNPCELIIPEQLVLTIFGTSIFHFPPMPHFIELPRMDLFFLNGFPFTRWPDGHETIIYLAQADFDTVVSALNLLGSISQKNGYPLMGIKISFEKPQAWEGELIVLGDIASIPEDLKTLAPLKLTKKTVVPYPIIRSWAGEKALAFSTQISSFGSGKGAIMEFQSPYKKGRSVLLLTADTTKDLCTFTEALLDAGVQSKCIGDLAIVNNTLQDYTVYVMDIGGKYYSGESGKISTISAYLYSLNNLYYFILIGLIIVLGLTIFYLLNKHRKTRLQDAKEHETETKTEND